MNKSTIRTAFGSLALGAALTFTLTAHAAQTMLTLPSKNGDIRLWSDGGTYNPLFNSVQTWNGVQFDLSADSSGNTVFLSDTLDIPVNLFGIGTAYTLINSAWGVYGSAIGSIEFFGTNSAYHKVDLVEGLNVRDHYAGGFNNVIDNVTAIAAFDNGPFRARLDMQIYDLPGIFDNETLVMMRFTSEGFNPVGVPFLAAATVVTATPAIPEPESWALMCAGLALLGLARRRRTLRGR